MSGYIWGVWCTTDNELHRDNMTQGEAEEWVRSWNEDLAPQAKPDIFIVCRRPVGPWEVKVDGKYVEFVRE